MTSGFSKYHFIMSSPFTIRLLWPAIVSQLHLGESVGQHLFQLLFNILLISLSYSLLFPNYPWFLMLEIVLTVYSTVELLHIYKILSRASTAKCQLKEQHQAAPWLFTPYGQLQKRRFFSIPYNNIPWTLQSVRLLFQYPSQKPMVYSWSS